jgi:hypothetical protein
MIATLHLCGPEGEALRQQLSHMLNMLKEDNRYVINAMLHSGLEVPDSVVEAQLDYVPSRHEKAPNGEPVQVYYGMRAMFDSGTFSCAEAAGFEAAVMEEKYGVPTECVAVAFDNGDHHAIFVTPDGEVDPTENYLRFWEGQLGLAPVLTSPEPRRTLATQTSLGAVCRIIDGRVDCDVEDRGSCVDAKRRTWRSSDKKLHGTRAEVEEIFQGQDTRKRWARMKSGVFVPVCGGA